MLKIKPVFYSAIIVIVVSALNFMVFLEAYKKLAFPFIHEEQRVENAPYIFLYILPSFVLVAVISLVLIKMTAKKMSK
ncbi:MULTISPECIES: hypothetical protein [unclassified Arsukibacterium]|uniref:hypothetical protein n=1 Tax=unclassified Arsukibacterium TaxID=2635278 RepID=UPI000C52058B|nr:MULTISPECIES: hypothetical protein [unclassified Arsukibacterium]MAA95711.1 hypothetical protein [Rheinheimera sp.]MBM35358.1 hypothetical protein [Rheinheimera sp.]HAW92068.1 hypothetical protein [Candidatus Azambacteria bacterium]|tara:strand:- start:181 stop:414 length:234 start_codon:yes stop_codon:yes gene_type:complete